MFIGLMSGTSVDAIDAVLVDFTAQEIDLKATYSHPWSPELRAALLRLGQQTQANSTLHELAQLDVLTGEVFAHACLQLLQHAGVAPQQIDAIGSPGQTIFHAPTLSPPYTWQLGNPNIIAELTGIATVADFRRRDMAAGGQGAPLASAFHQAYLYDLNENRIVVNIGGIANITLIPANAKQNVIGFDTGPGNALLDVWSALHTEYCFDNSGSWAASGVVQTQLLQTWLQDAYFHQLPPKTTGRDYFNLNWLEKYALKDYLPVDVQATLSALTATTLAQAILPYTPQRVLICGGGVHNHFLMKQLQQQLPCPVASTASQGIDPDWMEAMCFAWMAKQRLAAQPNQLPSVTGARHLAVLGAIFI
jgi:anhydro-N-acetylmuramic acid kinase